MALSTAILDANVLFSPPLRDLLIRLAIQDLYSPKWTQSIHTEWMEAVLKRRPDIIPEQLERTRRLMDISLEGSLVEGYESIIPDLNLPDPDDRHVLAAAIKADADFIITLNLKDFPAKVLDQYHVKAKHPDSFVHDLFVENPVAVIATMKIQRMNLKNPPKTAEEYLMTFEKQGLVQTVGAIQGFKALI